MTQAKHPPEPPDTRAHDPGLRERVRERMRQMAPLALWAAIPLTNAACDPASPPTFGSSGVSGATPTCEKIPSSWAQFIRIDAVWGTEAGERIVLLTVTNPTDKPWLQAPSAYTIEGGTQLPSTPREPNVLRIKPDAGATTLRLRGTITCHIITEPMAITLDLATGTKNPTVVLEVG